MNAGFTKETTWLGEGSVGRLKPDLLGQSKMRCSVCKNLKKCNLKLVIGELAIRKLSQTLYGLVAFYTNQEK